MESQLAIFINLLRLHKVKRTIPKQAKEKKEERKKKEEGEEKKEEERTKILIYLCSFKSPTFDPVSFALGYGSHMIADQVGFYPKYGYEKRGGGGGGEEKRERRGQGRNTD